MRQMASGCCVFTAEAPAPASKAQQGRDWLVALDPLHRLANAKATLVFLSA